MRTQAVPQHAQTRPRGQTTARRLAGTPAARAWGADVRRLWQAYSISELGSAVGAGALPLVAVVLLDCSALQVSLLAVVSGVASAAVALPLGPWVEFRPKRPVMIGADVLRFAALASVPAAALLGRLTYGQLCVVAVAQTAGGIVFAAASSAHLRDLVPAAHRVTVYGRFETSQWMAHSVGSPAGGVLVSWLGATASVAVDAGSFPLSAVAVRLLRGPEPPPPVRPARAGRAREAVEGWRYILGHGELRALLVNAVIFGGGIMAPPRSSRCSCFATCTCRHGSMVWRSDCPASAASSAPSPPDRWCATTVCGRSCWPPEPAALCGWASSPPPRPAPPGWS